MSVFETRKEKPQRQHFKQIRFRFIFQNISFVAQGNKKAIQNCAATI